MAYDGSAELVMKPPSDTLVRDEPMTVPIVLQLATRHRVRSIYASFHGAEETKATYTTTHTNAKGHVTTQTHTAVEHVDIVKREWLLAGSKRRGFFSNLADAVATLFGGGRHSRMTQGDYQYEVELTIPFNAQPTHTGDRSRVFYELTARVDIPLGRDVLARQSFCVMPLQRDNVDLQPVRVCYPDDEGRGLWSSLFEPDLKLELTIDRDHARRGETIHGSFHVETKKSLNVKHVHARLVGHEQSEAKGHQDTHSYHGESMPIYAPGFIAPSWSTEFSLPVEFEGPPTVKGDLFSIDWFVEVTLDVPWAKDPKIRVPITLA